MEESRLLCTFLCLFLFYDEQSPKYSRQNRERNTSVWDGGVHLDRNSNVVLKYGVTTVGLMLKQTCEEQVCRVQHAQHMVCAAILLSKTR